MRVRAVVVWVATRICFKSVLESALPMNFVRICEQKEDCGDVDRFIAIRKHILFSA
jgi:hypothetical protein